MPLGTTLPFGLRDVKVYPLTGEAPGTGVDLPNSRTLQFSDAEDFEDLRGDDGLQATHGKGAVVNWQLEGGGISLDAVKVMFGGTLTDSGTTPNQKRLYTKTNLDVRPYFRIEGQAISDSGGDFHVVIPKAKARGELSGQLADGGFWLTGASGVGLPIVASQATPVALPAGTVYAFVQNESIVAIV
jgi:hypothetical protein